MTSQPKTDNQPQDLDAVAAARLDFWDQQIVAAANGSMFKVAKGIGSTEWHSHDDQDEVFLVTHGQLIIELRDREVRVGPGKLFVVPRNVEHRPRAESETRFLIVGRSITSNAAGGKPQRSGGEQGPNRSDS